MINKRLLIKNLIAHNDENSFYDKKRKIEIGEKEGKAKFLKHICALSNSNPKNNSYIVIGVEDEDNSIVGVDFFDDSKIQNLINAYLNNPPIVQYENIPFPHLNEDKVVGLVTIRPNEGLTSLKKNIWKYYGGSVFFRDGSISMPKVFDIKIKDVNSKIVTAIENNSQNNIQLTLDGVFDFMKKRKDYNPQYKVFKEYFVLCWSGQKKVVKQETFYSRVDIELINEQVRLFFSKLDEVSIEVDEHQFKIIEYVHLGFQNSYKYYHLEQTIIDFSNNTNYTIDSKLLFEPPQFDKKVLHHIYNTNNTILEKLKKGLTLTKSEEIDLKNLPATYLICYLNLFHEAIDKLNEAKMYLKNHSEEIYEIYKDTMRILRKVKYS
ncbi:MAG: ATP-binding protein [Flavobacteriia bacterium]|nr:ATP-binding protein [Flavobacteriia bacterium]OIP47710.1 MAG: AAA family ATPase [Flavobacteriaceae bacterium CG2_30_31_66]PIV97400.1 MAG: AAA family ATPase [Flavobacteriaceae bacterium CG17_big_fil_post_rev_8_21_14_2_50_31_13]PIX13260.1 MAG: AAA family ATPase [Flavobacteriaceae bacterium CG_4_8_14_3_um_filter_31_8]PIY14758.1 MAG: AAA family ATPase [Flavobacteriaceae bacterium CG_4_10_14_3_um_filter_31_253]PIZ12107.1 MAG: AAA family ATPase [Flavobacteriaceae bacterium CG_4_10_14_0_8_um_filte